MRCGPLFQFDLHQRGATELHCLLSIHTYTCIHLYIHIYMHTYIIYIYMHIRVSTCVCIHISSCTHVYVEAFLKFPTGSSPVHPRRPAQHCRDPTVSYSLQPAVERGTPSFQYPTIRVVPVNPGNLVHIHIYICICICRGYIGII